jgi:hypothetical protein
MEAATEVARLCRLWVCKAVRRRRTDNNNDSPHWDIPPSSLDCILGFLVPITSTIVTSLVLIFLRVDQQRSEEEDQSDPSIYPRSNRSSETNHS